MDSIFAMSQYIPQNKANAWWGSKLISNHHRSINFGACPCAVHVVRKWKNKCRRTPSFILMTSSRKSCTCNFYTEVKGTCVYSNPSFRLPQSQNKCGLWSEARNKPLKSLCLLRHAGLRRVHAHTSPSTHPLSDAAAVYVFTYMPIHTYLFNAFAHFYWTPLWINQWMNINALE